MIPSEMHTLSPFEFSEISLRPCVEFCRCDCVHRSVFKENIRTKCVFYTLQKLQTGFQIDRLQSIIVSLALI